MTVCSVPIEHLSAIWPLARPYIAKALARDASGRYEPQDVLNYLLAGYVRLWVSWNTEEKAVEAAIVTEIKQYPRLRELHIWLIGGRNMNAWAKEGLELVEAYARAHDCVLATGAMRRGWARVGLNATGGCRETGVSLEKRL